MKSTNIRWQRWAAGLLAAYTVAGFWLVPLAIKNQLPKFVQTELARRATIGEIKFNPYTLRLEAQDVRLAEADGAPFFAIGKFVVRLQWQSLFRRAWTFAEIRISAPSALLAITPDGKFNLAELLDTLARRPHEADSGMPRLIIDSFALEQGKVEVRDRRAGYSDNFFPINFALTNFSTLPERNGSHTFGADLEHGGKLRWKGDASLNPIRGGGELTLQAASLPELAVYLKSYTRATLAAGKLDFTLPYRFSYRDGKFEASLAAAKLSLRDLALAREGVADAFGKLARLDVSGIHADLVRREAVINEVRIDGGKLALKRDAKGELDLANLMIGAAKPAAKSAAVAADPAVVNHWKLGIKQLILDQMAVSAVDETVSPPVTLSVDKLRLQFGLQAEQTGANFKLALADGAFSLADLTLASATRTPFKLARFGLTDAALDLHARHASAGRLYAEGGQLQLTRDRKGQLDIANLLPKAGSAAAPAAAAEAAAGAPWVAAVKSIELSKFNTEVEDQGSGVKVHLQDLAVQLEGAGSDLAQPVKFNAGLSVREGGQLSAKGTVVPASGALETDVQVKQLALAPLQPLLAQYLKLKIAGGNVSAQGRLTVAAGAAKSSSLRYAGGFDIAGLALNEEDGERFATWKSVRADKLTASIAPNLLEIPVLRVIEPNATLIIENDRSFNAARLLVEPAASGTAAAKPAPAPAQAANDPFPVRIQRLRFENAKLDFTDLSLRPQFGAKIYELNGVVSGLSSKRDARSQIELDGRVNEFGLARIRGGLNPFAPRDNTDINVVFKNVDMVSASPYSMKFAGYKIAEGKISLDLQYKVRNSQLEGANQIVIDNLTLGERIDSPDALKLPLQLAIAILKDSDGRIDLGLPVAGDMNDPQFSYGAVVWKALGNVLTKIVTAPFRALGSLFGGSGEKLEGIDFDPGSDKLLPPEREKLKQVAKILAKRAQLKLSVPGQYSEAADGAVLRARAVQAEVAKRAGIKLEAGEETGALDLSERAVRGAVRGLYAERFGDAALDKEKKLAEGGAAAHAAPAAQQVDGDINSEAARKKLALWQRVGKLIQGEPQVADASVFYNKLQERLVQNQPLATDALSRLGTQRAGAILAAVKEAGADPASLIQAAPEKVSSDAGKPVSLKLGLAAK